MDIEETVPISTKITPSEKLNISIDSIPLPEISESIDAIPEEFSVITVDKQVEESIQPVSIPNRNLTSYETSKEVDNKPSAFERRFITSETTSTISKSIPTTSRPKRLRKRTKKPNSTTPAPFSTTTKNFRRDNDYYVSLLNESLSEVLGHVL